MSYRPFALFVCIVLSACGRSKIYTLHLDAGSAQDSGVVACVPGDLIPARVLPSVLLLVDKSASMNFNLNGVSTQIVAERRWNILQKSLSDTLLGFDRELSLGLALFPGAETCGASVGLSVAPSLGQGQAILTRLTQTIPRGGTPTFEALSSIESEISNALTSKTLILLTDGIPNCNANLNPMTCLCTSMVCARADQCSDLDRTVSKMKTMHEQKEVTTYVVGIGAAKEFENLNKMAEAGGAPRSNSTNKFYAGTSSTELTTALSDIATRLRSCHFSASTDLSEVAVPKVTLGRDTVPFGMGGWIFTNESSGDFVLEGLWCERAIAGDQVLMKLSCSNP
jgi:hypothetical protein